MVSVYLTYLNSALGSSFSRYTRQPSDSSIVIRTRDAVENYISIRSKEAGPFKISLSVAPNSLAPFSSGTHDGEDLHDSS